ncbi:MAG: hypothetical protein K8R21_01735 [Leptospira sp.]|nr:hypothetical protein [Leptospira sp.]
MTEEDLYKKFLSEKKKFRILKIILGIFGYSCLIAYVYVIFFTKNHEPKFVLFGILSVYARLSGFVLNKYCEVPEVFVGLYATDENISDLYYDAIDHHRNEILLPLLKNVYGILYPKEMLDADKNKIIGILGQLGSHDWKRIGRLYLLKFISIVSLTMWIIFL